MTPIAVLQLLPEYREYLWGGERLRPGHAPTAEAWVIYEQNRIAAGPLAGQTLADAVNEYGAALVGTRALARTGTRFPLLIKLLDCAQWLSLQVHPDDAQAARLEGPEHWGKTEAWHILEAAPNAQLITGFKPGLTTAKLTEVVHAGTLLDYVHYETVQASDTILMRAGTLHAIGPGLLLYEAQQTSDLTYRVFDWNRPQTGNRVLHLEKSLAVLDPTACARAEPLPPLGDGDQQVICHTPFFTLEVLNAQRHPLVLRTTGDSFHALTIIAGAARLMCGATTLHLERFATVLIAASAGEYQLLSTTTEVPVRVLKASLAA